MERMNSSRNMFNFLVLSVTKMIWTVLNLPALFSHRFLIWAFFLHAFYSTESCTEVPLSSLVNNLALKTVLRADLKKHREQSEKRNAANEGWITVALHVKKYDTRFPNWAYRFPHTWKKSIRTIWLALGFFDQLSNEDLFRTYSVC